MAIKTIKNYRITHGIWPEGVPMKASKKFCHIYIFRHAQTYFNKDHRFTGWMDSNLTPLGKRQAKLVARKLKGKNIDVAFYSHLSRSRDTAKEVLRYHPECKARVMDDRIIERCYGDLQGTSHEQLVKRAGKENYDMLIRSHKIEPLVGKAKADFISKLGNADLGKIRRSYSHAPPNGESIKMVEKRVISFVRDLLVYIKKNKVDVAISAHGNSMRPFRRYFEKFSVTHMMQIENPWDDYFEYKVRISK